MHVKKKGATVAFLEPYLDATSLDNEVVSNLLNAPLSPQEIQREFALISSQRGTTEEEINETARKALVAAMAYKTPAKLKQSFGELNPSNLTKFTSTLLQGVRED